MIDRRTGTCMKNWDMHRQTIRTFPPQVCACDGVRARAADSGTPNSTVPSIRVDLIWIRVLPFFLKYTIKRVRAFKTTCIHDMDTVNTGHCHLKRAELGVKRGQRWAFAPFHYDNTETPTTTNGRRHHSRHHYHLR